MIRFREFLLKEGGNAIKDSVRINQENVEATLDEIYKKVLPLLKIDKKDVALLGSTGKKLPGGSSGDIDLAISVPELIKKNKNISTIADVFDAFVEVGKKIGYGYKDMRSIGVVSIGFPIVNKDGKQPNSIVQLDFMPSENLSFSTWMYFSPAEWESKYKGIYRNLLLMAIAREMNYKTLEKAMNKEGKEVDVTWERLFLDLKNGLMKGTQTILGKKGIVKSPKTLTKEMITMDPQEIVDMLFGPGFKPEDFLTWESTFKAVTSPKFVYKDKLKKILKLTHDGLVNAGYPAPEEIKNYL